jgi:hypothetical protein
MKATKQGNSRGQFVSSPSAVLIILAAVLVFGPKAGLRGQSAGWQLVPPESVPEMGTFGSMQLTNMPPLPYNPLPELDVYWCSNTPGWLWVDDRAIDYEALRQERQTARALRSMEIQSALDTPDDLPPLPGGWEGDGEDPGPGPLGPETVYPEGYLRLSIAMLTNGVAPLRLTNTFHDVLYEVLSKVALTNGVWTSEKVLLGATNQNWTATEVSVGERTNSLFFWAVSLGTRDIHSVPWAWYVEHGLSPLGPGIGLGDADGDTLLNWQEYQWGSDPQQPEGFSVWVSCPAGYSGIP